MSRGLERSLTTCSFYKKTLQIFISTLFRFSHSLSFFPTIFVLWTTRWAKGMFFTLVTYNTLVFNFSERAYPGNSWFFNGLFRFLCSLLMNFSGHIISVHFSWRKCPIIIGEVEVSLSPTECWGWSPNDILRKIILWGSHRRMGDFYLWNYICGLPKSHFPWRKCTWGFSKAKNKATVQSFHSVLQSGPVQHQTTYIH